MKYLDINLSKYVQDLYKTLMNKIKDLNKTQCCQDVSSSQLDLQIQCKMNVKCKLQSS